MFVTGAGGLFWLWLLSLFGHDRVEVCHVTRGGHVFEVRVASAAVPAHLGHGDFLPIAFYDDADSDGFGDPYAETLACEAPAGTVANADDCDDSADFVSPTSEDVCGNTVDEDCTGGDTLCSVESDGWTVTAGRIEETPEGLIYGTFTLHRVSDDAVTTRGGGACLVADLFSNDPALATYTCASHADCAHVTPPPGGFMYCGSPDGSGEPNRCWTRPGNYCSRSPSREEGTYLTPATTDPELPTRPGDETLVPAPGHAGQGGVPVRWMVLVCLADASSPSGCAGSDPTQRIFTYGPTFVWGD